MRGAVHMGQLLALEARQGGYELCCGGWRAAAAHIRRQTRQDLLQLGKGKSRACWRELIVEWLITENTASVAAQGIEGMCQQP